MLTTCEFCGRECERPCRDLSDMALKQQRGEERCRRALLDKINMWTISESGLSMTRTTTV